MAKKKSTDKTENNLLFPLFALENLVLTPMIPQPIKIDNEEQREFLDHCVKDKNEIFVATSESRDNNDSNPQIKEIGMVCLLDKVLQMPGAPTLAFIRPLYRAKYNGMVFSPAYPMAKVVQIKDVEKPRRISAEYKVMMERADHLYNTLIQYIGDPEKTTAQKLVEEHSSTPVQHLYAISHVAPISWEEKYSILLCNSYQDLISTVVMILDDAEQRISLQAKIHEKTHRELSQQQKENFLRVHLKQIKQELGETDENEDFSELMAKSVSKKWSKETEEFFKKELQKLRRLNVNNPEYSVQFAYLETFLDLPWNNYHTKKLSLDKVEEILNRDHYGLEKVKERILEYMAVLKLRNDLKAPILCLIGPPGVGKTSIGKSVAEAVGREYARIALGGMHDEAEIRGHRRTYIGAMPGRFLHALSKCKYGNALILLDEIDKVGKDYKGDPSSALLEALDPEQNNTFHDNFIDFPYDLSKVLFIATANDRSSIPAPLLDRMEIIEMPGYTLQEKREIAFRHLIDQALEDNGFKKGEINFSAEAVDSIIKFYTNEKGVRQLKKAINRIIRKLAYRKVKGNQLPAEVTVDLVNEFVDKNELLNNPVGFQI